MNAIEAPLRVGARLDQAGRPQHPQVLGYRRLTDLERADQLAHRPLALAEQIQDQPPVGLRHHLKRRPRCHGSNITTQLYTCQAMDSAGISAMAVRVKQI